MLVLLSACSPVPVASLDPVAERDYAGAFDPERPIEPETADSHRNILVVLLDDVGVQSLASYDLGAETPATPTLDALAETGIRFASAYAEPVCSATRAAIQTGRPAWATGVTLAVTISGRWPLPLEETTLPELLGPRYDSSYLGKWHLGSDALDYERHPNDSGWAHYSGVLSSFAEHTSDDGLPQTWWSWIETTNGVSSRVSGYNTTATTDRAIERMGAMEEPWITMVAYVAAHAPLHWPPPDLWSGVPVGQTVQQQQYNAVIESLDAEIGRLLAAAPPDTTVIVLGDNGPWDDVVAPPFDPDKAKGFPYEVGTRIPLLVAGPLVAEPGSVSPALVHATDLFATVADVAGVELDPAGLDSISLLPYLRDPALPSQRDFVVSQWLSPGGFEWSGGARGIRDSRYRLVEFVGVREELYDLQGVDQEGDDLLQGTLDPDQQAALDNLRAAWPYAVSADDR